METGPQIADPALPGAARRPCARCGARFRPTRRRRLLCKGCFHGWQRPHLGALAELAPDLPPGLVPDDPALPPAPETE